MALQETVEKAVRHGRSVIKMYEEEVLKGYVFNETTTRYAIIDPILTALGWKLDDPTRCRFEEWHSRKGENASGHTDYTLYKHGKPLVVIEAKSLSKYLNEFSEENQLKNYQVSSRVKKRVLTNGAHWYFYESSKDYGGYRDPEINLYGTLADDKKTGRDATISEMAQLLIEKLGYRRL